MNEFNDTEMFEEDLPDFDELTSEPTEPEETPEETEAAPQPEAIESKQSDVLMQYLTALAQTDAQVAEGLKNPKKNQTKMYAYIRSEAQKQAKNQMAMVKDEVVYGWAIHYWTEEMPSDNEKKSEPKKSKPKSASKTTKPTPKTATPKAPISVTPTTPATPEKITSIRDRYKKSHTTEDIPSLF